MTTDYTIRVSYNPKSGPRRLADAYLWDCWLEDDPEDGTEHGPTAAAALRAMAERLEDE